MSTRPERPRRLRTIRRVAVFLLLGAVVNVAVAGGFWLRLPAWEPSKRHVGVVQGADGRAEVLARHDRGVGIESIELWRVETSVESLRRDIETYPNLAYDPELTLPRSSYVWRMHRSSDLWPPDERTATELRVGWPSKALAFYRVLGIPWSDVSTEIYGLVSLSTRAFPVLPVWPGFAINAVFYAGVLCLLWSTPFAARRLIRKRRGRCVRCGYDLTGTEHDVCPECGL